MYVVRDTKVFPQENAESFSKKLPPGIYNLSYNPLIGFFLEKSPTLSEITGKVYGDVNKKAERVICTFKERLEKNMNTGVLLSGKKGSGKTMLARRISKQLAEEGIATIIINSTVNEDNVAEFTKFLNLIDTQVVVLFDEFEKNFNETVQKHMLSVFDGISVNCKLFILTVNDLYSVSSYMINRPGRIYYKFDYSGLEQEFIEEYIEDNLINVDLKVETAAKIVNSFKNNFTFDMLQSVVEEMNRYDINIYEAVKWLNVDIRDVEYEAICYRDGTEMERKIIESPEIFNIWDRDINDYITFRSDSGKMNKETGTLTIEQTFKDKKYTVELKVKKDNFYTRSIFLGAF